MSPAIETPCCYHSTDTDRLSPLEDSAKADVR